MAAQDPRESIPRFRNEKLESWAQSWCSLTSVVFSSLLKGESLRAVPTPTLSTCAPPSGSCPHQPSDTALLEGHQGSSSRNSNIILFLSASYTISQQQLTLPIISFLQLCFLGRSHYLLLLCFVFPQGDLAMSRDIFSHHNWGATDI